MRRARAPSGVERLRRARELGLAELHIHEVVLPKLFKWYKDDFGFSKQEILVRPASSRDALV